MSYATINGYNVEVVEVAAAPSGHYGGRARVTWNDERGVKRSANTFGGGKATLDAYTWVKPGMRVDVIRNGRGTIIAIRKHSPDGTITT